MQLLLAEPLMGWAATLAHGLPPLLLLHCGAAPLVPESPERLQLLAVLSMAEAAWPPRRWWVVGLQVASAGAATETGPGARQAAADGAEEWLHDRPPQAGQAPV